MGCSEGATAAAASTATSTGLKDPRRAIRLAATSSQFYKYREPRAPLFSTRYTGRNVCISCCIPVFLTLRLLPGFNYTETIVLKEVGTDLSTQAAAPSSRPSTSGSTGGF
jgi:hypothetical protein